MPSSFFCPHNRASQGRQGNSVILATVSFWNRNAALHLCRHLQWQNGGPSGTRKQFQGIDRPDRLFLIPKIPTEGIRFAERSDAVAASSRPPCKTGMAIVVVGRGSRIWAAYRRNARIVRSRKPLPDILNCRNALPHPYTCPSSRFLEIFGYWRASRPLCASFRNAASHRRAPDPRPGV
jgi:hypothetical protein